MKGPGQGHAASHLGHHHIKLLLHIQVAYGLACDADGLGQGHTAGIEAA